MNQLSLFNFINKYSYILLYVTKININRIDLSLILIFYYIIYEINKEEKF